MDENLKHTIEFLDGKVNKNHGFSTPDDYFEGLEDRIFLNLSEDSIPDTTSFKLPDNYFDTFEEELFTKVISNGKSGKVITFKQKVRALLPSISAAAVVLFVFGYALITLKEDIRDTDVEYWYDNGYGQVTNYDISQVIDNDVINSDLLNFKIDDNSLENYLSSIENNDLLQDLEE